MYFPYLRGRQFELIALRELAQENLIGKHITPIIEPVKLSSTLIKTLEVYVKHSRNVSVIMNPCVGKLDNKKLNNKEDKVCENLHTMLVNPSITASYHLKKTLKDLDIDFSNIVLIANDKESTPYYNDIYTSEIEPLYTLMKDESDFRRNIRNKNRVILSDNFNKQAKNADYNGDEFFTRDHLYYKDDGYVGFADYSVVGDDYTESGFAPYAVAIHIVYFDKDNTMRVHHFVSDSNDDYSDTTGKFHEALEKLIRWNETMKLDTYAMKEFQRLFAMRAYPGLGTVKKLTIMHHLELVSSFLDDSEA